MKITLSYQKQSLPPPFAYAAVLNLDTGSKEHVEVTFHLEYLDRNDLSDDELRAEGFTRDDDFKWSGQLDKNWITDVESFKNHDFVNVPHEETYLHVQIDNTDYNFPREIEQAELRFQELMQAILENAKLEAPLTISLMNDNRTTEITWNFSERSVQIERHKSFKWELGRNLMKEIYSIDFEALEVRKKGTNKCINVGDGSWYLIDNQKRLAAIYTLINSINP